MTDRDELAARAATLGIKVDRRWGPARLAQAIAAAEAVGGGEPEVDVEAGPGHDQLEVPAGWPKRIAPLVWVDQAGGRHGSEPAAAAAAARIAAGREDGG